MADDSPSNSSDIASKDETTDPEEDKLELLDTVSLD
jgi:hypothetical protein